MAGLKAPFPRECRLEDNSTQNVSWSAWTKTLSTSEFPRARRFPLRRANGRSGQSHRRPLRVDLNAKQLDSAEQINAQQKAHTEALLEQNRAMKERIDALQKNESTIQNLQSEVERLRKELDCRKESAPTEADNASSDFSLWRAEPDRAEDEISDPGEIVLFPRSEADCQAFLVSQMAAERRVDRSTRRSGTTQAPEPSFSIAHLSCAHIPQRTMNQLKLSLRAADDPRTIKEENGVPTFASVFALHNVTRSGREETLPITVKASHELAPMLVNELKKGVAFVVEGRLTYYKNPETNRESYSIWADSLTEITLPKSTAANAS